MLQKQQVSRHGSCIPHFLCLPFVSCHRCSSPNCRPHQQSYLAVFLTDSTSLCLQIPCHLWIDLRYHYYYMACRAGRALKQHYGMRCHSTWHDQLAHVGGPNISRLNPSLQQQGHHAANAHLGPIEITPKNGRKVWWVCDQCPDGHLHQWESTVANRSSGHGCSQCSGRKVCKHNPLATKAPKVAAPNEANESTPDNVAAQSNQPVGWRSDAFGHRWSAAPCNRVNKQKSGCPRCADIARTKKRIKQPTLAECQDPHNIAVLAQWDRERNA